MENFDSNLSWQNLHDFCLAWMMNEPKSDMKEWWEELGWDFEEFRCKAKSQKWWVTSMQEISEWCPPNPFKVFEEPSELTLYQVQELLYSEDANPNHVNRCLEMMIACTKYVAANSTQKAKTNGN